MSELQSVELARGWLAAGLALSRVGDPGSSTLTEAAAVLDAAQHELAKLPPAGVLLDLSRVFLQPRPRIRRELPPALADVVRSYEDVVLGRLVVDPLRVAVSDALSGLPDRLVHTGVVVLVERILERVGFRAGQAVNPGALREVERTAPEDMAVRAGPALDSAAGDLLADAYEDLVRGFQRTGRPLRASDVVVLQQLEVLERRSDRLALSQVIAASELLARGLPRRVRGSRRREGHVSTRLLDDSAYPVGGFSSISTRGSIENLVTSELALMEDGEDVDLFDVRFMEGELLYYTRDETAFVRARRRITITLDPALVGARYRDEGLPYQRLVLGLGWITALVRVLLLWLDREDLLVRIVPPAEGLDAEVRLLGLTLAEGIQSGWVRIEPVEDLGATLASDTRVAPVDLIALTAAHRDLPDVQHGWSMQLVCSATPALTAPFAGEVAMPADPMEGWRRSLHMALLDLV
ncbi:MAG: hypothetical protein KC656_08560 [Myxococcales bacterium]|nr:hypothetical protein [Myxococcales bacterium]